MISIKEKLMKFLTEEQKKAYEPIYWFIHPQGFRGQGRTFLQCACIIEFCLTTGMPSYINDHASPLDSRMGERDYLSRGIIIGTLNKMIDTLNQDPIFKDAPIKLYVVMHDRRLTRIEIRQEIKYNQKIEFFDKGFKNE